MTSYEGFWHFGYSIKSHAGSYMLLLQPASLPSPLYPPQRSRSPGKWGTDGSEPAGAPGDSRRRALSSWWSLTAVGSGAASRRARRSAVSNKWSDYPITSLSTSVQQKDMARRKTNSYHLANATKSIFLRRSTVEEEKVRRTHRLGFLPLKSVRINCASLTCQLANALQSGATSKETGKANAAAQRHKAKTSDWSRLQAKTQIWLPVCSPSSGFTTLWLLFIPAHHQYWPSCQEGGGGEMSNRGDGEWWWRPTVHPLVSSCLHPCRLHRWMEFKSWLNLRSGVGEGGGAVCYERGSDRAIRWLRARERSFTLSINNTPRSTSCFSTFVSYRMGDVFLVSHSKKIKDIAFPLTTTKCLKTISANLHLISRWHLNWEALSWYPLREFLWL